MLIVQVIHPKRWISWILESADNCELSAEKLSENAKNIKIDFLGLKSRIYKLYPFLDVCVQGESEEIKRCFMLSQNSPL